MPEETPVSEKSDNSDNTTVVQPAEVNESKKNMSLDKLSRVPVDLTIEVGKAVLPLQEVMGLKEGDVVPLNKLSTEPFDVKVNGQKIAEGEIVQNENHFYVKLSKIIDKME